MERCVAAGLAAVIGMANTGAQTAEPYKLGMFQQGNRSFVGMVIQKDTVVVDLSRANVGAPATLKQLIAQWDVKTGVSARHARGHVRAEGAGVLDEGVGGQDAAADSRSRRCCSTRR